MTYRTRSDIISSALYFADLPHGGYSRRLYYCKAFVIHPDFSDFVVLRSYNAIVAAYQFSTGILWVFAFYSHTTAGHVARFRNFCRLNFGNVRKVNLYNDSTVGKRKAAANNSDDFTSVIKAALNAD